MVALLVVALLALVFWPRAPVHEIELVDQCGLLGAVVSHSIPSEGTCRVRCSAQCDAADYSLKEAVFIEHQQGCHECTCFCNEGCF